MGDVVILESYRQRVSSDVRQDNANGLVPIEFATAIHERHESIAKLAEYGIETFHVRRLREDSDALLYLITVRQALAFNKSILEKEELDDSAVALRIDLIQMLENADAAMLSSFWQSFTLGGLVPKSD